MQMLRRGMGAPALSGVFAAALMVTAAASLAPAAPLDPKTCEQLKAEVAQLEGMGVRANMAKGAAWGRANLRSADLEKVKKLIEMDEHIAFRCPRPKPVEPAVTAAQAKPKVKVPVKSAKAQPNGTDPAVAKPKPRPKPAAADPAGAAPQTAAAQPKPKPKPPAPKAQDAFTPPPKAPAAQ